uniref:NET domain-containing protein n=1 Tax=Oryza meridionalis TaxID=40149 RepID=A0A0E0DPY1_9ORYZ
MAVGMAPPPPTAAALPSRRRLRERIQSERQVVGGLLKKAEALVARAKEDVHGGRAAAAHSEACALPRRGRRFLDGAASPRKKRRKAATSASPIVEVEVIEPTMPKAQMDRLYGLLASLSAEVPFPPHIVALMQSQCCCVVDPNGEEMDVDLGSAKDAALLQLLNLLEEFAQQQTKIEEQEPPKIEVLNLLVDLSTGERRDQGADMDICGGVSPLIDEFSPLLKQQEDDELIDTSGGGGVSLVSPPGKQQEEELIRDASPVAVDKFPHSGSPSPSSSSSSSSSTGSSSGSSSSSSSSSGSSGSSCSGSSSSSTSSGSDSNSDDDADSATSRPDNSELPTEAAAKPLEQQQVTVHDTNLITEKEASPQTEMQELIARAQENQKLRRELDRKKALELERKRAREQLQEMERTARPVYDSIDPSVMKQLGISGEAQYIVSPVKSQHSLHRRRGGGLLQKLGFFLKE